MSRHAGAAAAQGGHSWPAGRPRAVACVGGRAMENCMMRSSTAEFGPSMGAG